MGINIHSEPLRIDGTLVDATALTSGTAYYTDKIKVRSSRGFTGLLLVIAGGAPDLDVSFETSLNGIDWYGPVNTGGTALNTIYTALAADAWIVFNPQLTRWIRFLLDPDANTTVTATYIQQEGD
jgi:hypothetical protein